MKNSSKGHTLTVCLSVHVHAADDYVLLAREGAVPVLLAVLKQHMTEAGVGLIVTRVACTALAYISLNGVCTVLTLSALIVRTWCLVCRSSRIEV